MKQTLLPKGINLLPGGSEILHCEFRSWNILLYFLTLAKCIFRGPLYAIVLLISMKTLQKFMRLCKTLLKLSMWNTTSSKSKNSVWTRISNTFWNIFTYSTMLCQEKSHCDDTCNQSSTMLFSDVIFNETSRCRLIPIYASTCRMSCKCCSANSLIQTCWIWFRSHIYPESLSLWRIQWNFIKIKKIIFGSENKEWYQLQWVLILNVN